MSIAREAWPFVLPVALAAALALILGRPIAGALLALAALGITAFFRVPRRVFAGDSRLILAPANGVVTRIDAVEEPEIGPGRFRRVVTFLSVFDVHVQRAPVAGRVVLSRFQPGRKVAAFRRAAGEVNQNHLLVIERPGGQRFAIKQIAGLLARRVVCRAQVGNRLDRGELFGLIKFGSRVDLYLPEACEINVKPGDKLTEGLTVVAAEP